MYTFIYVYILYTVYIYMKMRYVYEYIYIYLLEIYTHQMELHPLNGLGGKNMCCLCEINLLEFV